MVSGSIDTQFLGYGPDSVDHERVHGAYIAPALPEPRRLRKERNHGYPAGREGARLEIAHAAGAAEVAARSGDRREVGESLRPL
jgi:hypothetical protein